MLVNARVIGLVKVTLVCIAFALSSELHGSMTSFGAGLVFRWSLQTRFDYQTSGGLARLFGD